eukprot:NODE_1213_length_2559_cov_4.817434.p1 GENE.NODE_1213_length_2559_cov_4.817434~~NODE_1213_length_2559_cov_4.817434.p1  ORF type:complete len:834 (-),score=313.21 NODE_1213_length_2559_cov_4.817434:57-2480(-)
MTQSLDWNDRDKVLAKTPWEVFEVSVVQVQVDGECALTGRRSEALLTYDIDIGMGITVEKELIHGDDEKEAPDVMMSWMGLAQIVSFNNHEPRPTINVRLDDDVKDIADEVSWYFTEGMGCEYIYHALARWRAYAVKKWTKVDLEVEDPRANPKAPPAFAPFRTAQRVKYVGMVREEVLNGHVTLPLLDIAGPDRHTDPDIIAARGLCTDDFRLAAIHSEQTVSFKKMPYAGKKTVVDREEKAYESPPVSDEEDDHDPRARYELDEHTMEHRKVGAPPKMKRFNRYPFLPSMLCGVGGPATDWLRPKSHAVVHPEWLRDMPTREGGAVHAMDVVMDKARKKREELESTERGRKVVARGQELCHAIESGDFMKAFSAMDEESASSPCPETGRCAPHYCATAGHKEMLEMLIQARADINVKDALGQTALMMAARAGNNEMTKLLLEAGADATEEDALGRSAGDMVKVLPKPPPDPIMNWQTKAKSDADDPAKKSHELKEMIEEKDKPKRQGTQLILALKQKDVRTAEASIAAGADMSLTDDDGDTPLLILAKGKWKSMEGLQVRIAGKMHRAGADVNFRNIGGNTALLFSAHRGTQQMVEMLLSAKADGSTANNEGNTALMYAANGGFENICTALLEAFVSPEPRNRYDLSAEEMATRRGFKSCAVLIQAYELAPKKAGDDAVIEPKKKDKKPDPCLSFNYSKWDALNEEMKQDEQIESNIKEKEMAAMMQKPMPTMADMGPEAFGLPSDTPWPPPDNSQLLKGPFDYSRWDKILHDCEMQTRCEERAEYYESNPTYQWRDGEKCRVIF